MEKLTTYYPAFSIQGKSADEIFRALCLDKPEKKLNEVTWKETFINRIGEIMHAVPNPREVVSRIINEGLAAQGLPEIDTERTYFNTFGSGMEEEGHVYHFNSLIESYRVTDACLMNIFVERYFDDWDVLGKYATNGIYSAGKEGGYYPDYDYGPDANPVWGPNEQVCHSQVIADILYQKSVWDEFKKDCTAFWETHGEAYADMLGDTALAMAAQQYKNQTLTEESFLMVRNAYYGVDDEVQVTLLDIYGYASTDIICLEQKELPTPRVVLYIPGGAQPFMEFLNLSDMKQWIVWHLKDDKNMNAFRKHFSLKARQEGISFTGVDNALKYIAEESPEWPAETYILYEPTHLEAESLFGQIRDRSKTRLLEDGDVQIKSNSEATRDYALSLVDTFLSQLSAVDMIIPEIGIPINLALSTTAMGLSSEIVAEGDSYNERVYGVGELVKSVLFTGLNMLPVISETASVLKTFARTAEDLPAFLTEEQYIASHFGMSEEELAEIVPGDAPRVPEGDNPNQMRLVRLSNEEHQLAVLTRLGGNQFIRLNPITLEEMENSLVSEVINPETGKFHYITHGKLIGGSPYSPFRVGTEGIWTPEILKKQAAVTGKPVGASYKRILERLGQIHSSQVLDERQGLMHDLMELIDNYETAHPESGRLTAFRTLRTQLEEALYIPEEMDAVKTQILGLPNKGSGAARFLLRTTMDEMAGQGSEITANLIRFAKQDAVISAPFRGYTGAIPTEVDFAVKYVVEDLEILNNLPTNYYELPAYESWEATNNAKIMEGVVREVQNMNLLPKCRIVDNSLYIGHTYEEMFHSISEYSAHAGSSYELHPLTFFNMLEEAHAGYGFEQSFATRAFFNETVGTRMSLMENSMLLSDGFNYSEWDALFGGANFDEEFEAMEINDRIFKCINTYRGVVMQNTKASIDFFLDNLPAFIKNGLTDIAVTDLPFDLVQEDISRYMQEAGGWQKLDAMLMNLDKGEVTKGTFRRLLIAAKDNHLRFVATGHADNSVAPFAAPYKAVYYKGNTVIKSIEELDQEGKRFVIFADERLINSTPGTDWAMPGLAQYLKVPGTMVDSEGTWIFMPDAASSRVAIEAPELENWKTLAPSRGRIIGLKQFKVEGGIYPTDNTRLPLLQQSVPEELQEALMEKINEIKTDEGILSVTSSMSGSCDTVAGNVFKRLEEMGVETGRGASITWWSRKGGLEFGHSQHTTASFRFNGKEYVVDGSHLQFVHDDLDTNPVLILPIDDWAEEIVRRVRAINPFMEYTFKHGNALAIFMPPYFTLPRLKRPM